MRIKERLELLLALSPLRGRWAGEQVELLARLRGEVNIHKEMVPKRKEWRWRAHA